MNEQQNVYACPVCGGQGRVCGIMPLIENIRYDSVQCECGVQWRVYYKFENPKVEVVYVPQNDATDPICEESSCEECIKEVSQGE